MLLDQLSPDPKACTLVEHILSRGQLRFSRFQDVNDPREAKDWVLSFHYLTSDFDFDFRKIETVLNGLLKHSWRMVCFVSDVYEALVTKEREDRGEDIIGALYERGHSRPRMWAQYGENYKGACLVFDKARLDADIRSAVKVGNSRVYADLVEYKNPRIVPALGKPNALMISIDEVKRLGIEAAVEAHVSSLTYS